MTKTRSSAQLRETSISVILMRLIFLILSSLLMFGAGYADPDAKAIAEIDYLMAFVKKSDVIFIRNGKEYPVEDAIKLINNKYGSNKEKIKTAEDFIEKSATKSEHSGLPYEIKFKDNSKMESSKWLLEELKAFRERQTVKDKK